jgi:hypothetical protein
MSTRYNWERARQNCLSFKRQFHERDTVRRTFAKLDLDTLFSLLDSCTYSAHEMRVRLRADMNKEHWRLTATLHTEGSGGGSRPPDEQLHITIAFDTRKYHVRCRERANESVYVFDITV